MRSGDGHLLLTVGDHLTLLGELLDGVNVGLVRHLSFGLLDVVQVEGGRRGSQAGRGFVGDGGERSQGRHGGQGAHVTEGGRHGGRGHAGHGGAHVGHGGHPREAGQPHRTHVGHPHAHGQGEGQGQRQRGGGGRGQWQLEDGFGAKTLWDGDTSLRAHGSGIGFSDFQQLVLIQLGEPWGGFAGAAARPGP